MGSSTLRHPGDDQRRGLRGGPAGERRGCLRLLTHNVAYLNFEEDLKGTLKPGKLTDYLVLLADPREAPADAIQVEMTVVGGETVFAR